jgi:hypothetical protein
VSALPAERFHAIARLLQRTGQGFESSIRGTSMEPTIPDGARIRIRPGRHERGEVVACIVGEELFAHRVVHRGCDQRGVFVLTRGDGWILCDPPIRAERILGAVTEYWDGNGWRAPAHPEPLKSWKRAISLASFWVVRASVVVHHEFARRIAGCMLTLGALCKRFRGPRGGNGSDRATRR